MTLLKHELLETIISARFRHSRVRLPGTNIMTPYIIGVWKVGKHIVEVSHDNGEFERAMNCEPARILYGISIKDRPGEGTLVHSPEEVLHTLMKLAES